MNNRNITQRERNGIISRLEATIKKYGADKTKSVTIRYFNNMKERQKAQKQIVELERELAKLKRKR